VKPLIFALALFLVSCALIGQVAYTGPVYDGRPFIGFESHFRWNTASDPQNPHWSEDVMGTVTNPSDDPMVLDIDCTWTLITGLRLPPRTTQYFLADPHDVDCRILDWVRSDAGS